MRPEIKLDGERAMRGTGWEKKWHFKFGQALFRLQLDYEGEVNGVIYWKETLYMNSGHQMAKLEKELSKKVSALSNVNNMAHWTWTASNLDEHYSPKFVGRMFGHGDRSFELNWAGTAIDFWDGPGSNGGNERQEVRFGQWTKSSFDFDVTEKKHAKKVKA